VASEIKKLYIKNDSIIKYRWVNGVWPMVMIIPPYQQRWILRYLMSVLHYMTGDSVLSIINLVIMKDFNLDYDPQNITNNLLL